MRKLLGVLAVVLLAGAGCTSGSDEPEESAPAAATSSARVVTLDSLELDWPRTDGSLETAEPPAAPEGVEPEAYDRMARDLVTWATASTVDENLWRSKEPLADIIDVLPAGTAAKLRTQAEAQTSPRLAVANVFSDRVTVVGQPQVTSAWKVTTVDEDVDRPYVVLELQTRAAYEVRLGENGPSRVIGVLRVHALSAFDNTTDDFGVSGAWQEFGAGDCSLALDDSLIPDADLDGSAAEIKKFIAVGDKDEVVMPDLGKEEQVDSDYLQRCRQGSV